MDEPPLVPQTETAEAKQPASTSLFARMLNIFAVPGEVFEEVKSSAPRASNWLVPTLLCGLIGAVAAILMFSQPAILQGIHEQQAKALDARVKAGKMTQEQADQAQAMTEKFSSPFVLKISGSVAAMVVSFISVFWWAFLLWAISRVGLKAQPPFMKLVEVAGLASVISVLAVIIKLLLAVSLSNPMASPSLALLVKPDPQNKLYVLLNLVDIMAFWVLAVRAIGLAKLSGASFARSVTWVLGVWLALTTFWISIAWAARSIFGG